tara:strand:+ start:227 stop:451 length:225 start_codon:yes stop_codon:yes gene_type:complete
MSKVYTAVKAIILKEGKFLLLKQETNNKTHWELPGGKMQYGEKPEEALKREVKEETGMEITIEKECGCVVFFKV